MEEGEGKSESIISSKPGRKGCGRRKIEMKKIDNQRKLWVTFSKRKKGLLKKAAQLSRLTGEQVGVIIISEQGRVYSSENADAVVQRYLSVKAKDGEEEERGGGVVMDGGDGVWWSKGVNFDKIKEGKLSLEEVKEFGDVLAELRNNVVARMKEIKGGHSLIDLNKIPDVDDDDVVLFP